jgi:polyferredoxin
MVTEYQALEGPKSYIAAGMFVSIFLSFVVALPLLTHKRVQCSVFCPFGAFQSLLNPVSPYRIAVDMEKCNKCMRCVEICPTNSIQNGKPGLTCTKCGECVDACPKKAISYRFSGSSCHEKTPWRKLSDRLSPGKGLPARLSVKVLKGLDILLSPRVFFTFTAFLLGATISGPFGVGTVERLLNLVLNGSFLLK